MSFTISSSKPLVLGTTVTLTLTGSGTAWTGGTTFTATAGTITAKSVTSSTAATLTYVVGSATGTVTFGDQATTATLAAVVFDFTTDPALFAWYDHGSNFYHSGTTPATAGQQVVTWTDRSGNGYDLVAGAGTGIVYALDGGNVPYLNFNDGASNLTHASSTPFDAAFTDAAGFTVFAIFEVDSNPGRGYAPGPGIVCKNLDTNFGDGSPCDMWFVPAGEGHGFLTSRNQNIGSYRPYTLGTVVSGAVSYLYTTGFGSEDGTRVWYEGSRASTNAGPVGGVDSRPNSVGRPLVVGSVPIALGDLRDFALYGKLRCVLLFKRVLNDHEILAIHRHYAALYGMPDHLTGGTALVWESDSESILSQGPPGVNYPGPWELGPCDDVAVGLSIPLGATFNIARPTRTTTQIIAAYPTIAGPLLAYLKSLGVRPAVHLWEFFNEIQGDGTGLPTAAKYLAYRALLPSGTPFSAANFFAVQSFPDAAAGRLGAFNAQVRADGAGHGYPVADIAAVAGYTAYDAAKTPDGVHVTPGTQSGGVVLAGTNAVPALVPAFQAAVAASLAAPPFSGFPSLLLILNSTTGF